MHVFLCAVCCVALRRRSPAAPSRPQHELALHPKHAPAPPHHAPRTRAHARAQCRLTLLLGPPGSGKSVLMKALSGQLRETAHLRATGEVTWNGCVTLSLFYALRELR